LGGFSTIQKRHRQTVAIQETMSLRPLLKTLLCLLCCAWSGRLIAGQAALEGIVLDDTEGLKYGAWITSTNQDKKRVGDSYVHDNNANKGHLEITFTPDIAQAGVYEIILVFPRVRNAATNVPVKITAVGLPGESAYEQTRLVNEGKPDSTGFGSLGKFYLPKGRRTSMIISNRRTSGYVAVDGMQFIPQF
jgi:hypothetical protein